MQRIGGVSVALTRWLGFVQRPGLSVVGLQLATVAAATVATAVAKERFWRRQTEGGNEAPAAAAAADGDVVAV